LNLEIYKKNKITFYFLGLGGGGGNNWDTLSLVVCGGGGGAGRGFLSLLVLCVKIFNYHPIIGILFRLWCEVDYPINRVIKISTTIWCFR